jgi:hypothetical protein
MKNLFFACALALSSSLMAIDRFVDPALGSGNGTTYFSTITSAVAAAVDGDRILIVSGNYAEPTLVLNKSLTLLSQTAGGTINYNGNITIAGVPSMKLQVLGFNLGVYSITGGAITDANANSRAKISLIGCRAASINFNQDYYEIYCIQCVASGDLSLRYGSVISSKMANLYFNDEPSLNIAGKNLVANDTVTGRISYSNDDYPLHLHNSLLNHLFMWRWNHSPNQTNKILNNEFIANCNIFFPYDGVPNFNIDFSNNVFNGAINFNSITDHCGCCAWCCGWYDYGSMAEGCVTPWSGSYSTFPNPNATGFFKWTYNGVDLPVNPPNGSQPLVYTEFIGENLIINKGNPNHEYYDIDLTVNDRGRTGGPYSTLNYNPITSATGKAFIFDLEIPADLFPGQAVDIKAKGYHKN